jgi:opacity protein-like surface antigen
MKRIVLVCSMLVLSTVAWAQIPSIGFGVHANITNANFPGPQIGNTDILKDVYGAGFGGGAHLDVGTIGFSFRFSADYLAFSPDNGKYQAALANYIGVAASQFSVEGGKISYWGLSANAKMPILPMPILTPYLTGGIGLGVVSVSDAKVLQNGTETKAYPGFSSESKTALNLGAGVDLKIGITLFLEVRYTWVLTDPKTSTLVPVALGITF